MKFVGHNGFTYDGEIEFGDGVVKIKKGKKDVGRVLSPSAIISVDLIKPSFLSNVGCIHIQVIGTGTHGFVDYGSNYATNMNAICFTKKLLDEALKFKEELDKFLAEAKTVPIPQPTVSVPQPVENNMYNELKQLKQLLNEGIITQEDFDKKKAQVLGI